MLCPECGSSEIEQIGIECSIAGPVLIDSCAECGYSEETHIDMTNMQVVDESWFDTHNEEEANGLP